MSEGDKPSKSPSEQLAEKITAVLLDKRLLLTVDLKKAQVSLAAGRLKAEDWRLLVEKSLDKENSNG